MTSHYNRSEILSFYDLSEKQRIDLFNVYGEDVKDSLFVELKGEALPLCRFIRTNKNNFTHAVYSLSYFSCYTVTLSKCGTEAVVAYKHF